MKKVTFICCLLFLNIGIAFSQKRMVGKDQQRNQERLEVKDAEREYSIIVYERQSDSPLSFDREIATGSRGFWNGIYDVYRSTFVGKITNLSTTILDTGVNLLVKAFTKKKENHANWLSSIQKEMTFTKTLPMQTEIADFYRNPSKVGAMDPEDMIFNGFGCRQYLTYKDEDGIQKKILVFEIACSLDDSKRGKERILHHGKFEIKVDSIRFNPYLCDLPNDSLDVAQVNEALRIPFDFERRKNLSFRLVAKITSSWMNEAIEIFRDQPLGQFQIDFIIPDSTVLDSVGEWKGYYTYKSTNASDQMNPKKNVMVSGECFIVPRSFIGYYDLDNTSPSSTPIWGTGQYCVNMQISERCQKNDQYYDSDDKWKEEWKKIKKRRSTPTIFNTLLNQAKNEFDWDNHKWVYTILNPVQSAVLVEEKKWVNHIIIGDEDGVVQSNNQQANSYSLSNKDMNVQEGQKPKGMIEQKP